MEQRDVFAAIDRVQADTAGKCLRDLIPHAPHVFCRQILVVTEDRPPQVARVSKDSALVVRQREEANEQQALVSGQRADV